MFTRCTKTMLAPALALALLGAACGDDDDAAEGAVEAVDQEASADDAIDSQEPTDGELTDEGDGDGAATSGADGTATLTLANGEEFEFSILCSLEPQMAADQEILFSITSYDEPHGFDATKFGEDAAVPGLSSIDVYDSDTYEAVWTASSVMGGVELTLDGSTVTGTGTFFEGDEGLGDGVEGELTASC